MTKLETTIIALFALFLSMCSAQPVHAADQRLAHEIIQCESSGRAHVWGDDHKSYGIAQFRKETFYEFANAAHLRRPNWRDPRQQIYLLNWGIDHGYANRWTCYRLIKKGKWPHDIQHSRSNRNRHIGMRVKLDDSQYRTAHPLARLHHWVVGPAPVVLRSVEGTAVWHSGDGRRIYRRMVARCNKQSEVACLR